MFALILDISVDTILCFKSFNEAVLAFRGCLITQIFFLLLSSQFTGLYIVSFVVITLGFIMFNVVPTYTGDQSYATNDEVYYLASSADVQQGAVDRLQKEGSDLDRTVSNHKAHYNGHYSLT